MWKPPVLDKALPYALLGMTAVTGVVDAVSFLFLGHDRKRRTSCFRQYGCT